ncbi:MAG TPA: Gfo/Idh/MocA family oxidoreductase [Gemmatimonadales bacterium]
MTGHNAASGWSRRRFLGTSAAVTAAMMLPAERLWASGSDTLRIGLIGCGGRGTGAARDCLRGSDGVELVALGDVFSDRIERCRASLAELAAEDTALGARINVANDRTFTGFDAYQGVLGAGIDMVLIATPPAFRPLHVAAAVNAGKHIFMEKPVAVDPTGVRSIIASSDRADARGLAIVAGTQRRHDAGYLEIMRRVHEGAIGEIVGAQVYWNQGGLWMHERQAEWSDVEWQLRNWLYFTWLSGDHIVEQHIHNLDVANWALQAHPVRAVGVGGRQWRTDPAYGHIFDHFAIDYEYPDGVHVMSMCRQIDGTGSNVSEHLVGTSGTANPARWIASGSSWRYEAERSPMSPYQQEHTDLVASIRAGAPLNEGRQVAESTLTAIMGREAAYTGAAITWDELLNANQSLVPEQVQFGAMAVAPVAIPGVTKLERTVGG